MSEHGENPGLHPCNCKPLNAGSQIFLFDVLFSDRVKDRDFKRSNIEHSMLFLFLWDAMMRKEKNISKKEWVIFLIAGICIVGLLGIVFIPNYSLTVENEGAMIYDEHLLSFNAEWYCETIERNVILPILIQANKDEIVVLSRVLPDRLTNGAYLRFRSIDAYVNVYIDGELIYKNGVISNSNGQAIPLNQWNFIELKPEYSGRDIRITFQSPYRYYSGILPEIILGSHSDVILYTFSESALTNYLSICIIAIGLIMVLLSLIHTVGDNSLHQYAYLGLFLAMTGLVLLSCANLPRNSSIGYYKDYLIMHIGIRLCVLLYSIYLFSKTGDKLRRISLIFAVSVVAMLVLSVVLHVIGFADFNQTLLITLIFFAIILSMDLYDTFFLTNNGKMHHYILSGIGVTVLLFTFLIEVLFRWSYLHHGQKMILVAGSLFFAIFQSISVIFMSYNIALEQIQIAKQLNEKRIKLMISQIQPHFIYNTLNTIRSMVKLAPEKAYEMIYHFSNYLKYNINSFKDRDLIPFSEELAHIKAYTKIECERFHKLKVKFEIEADNFLIPPLTIQPLVENAIKHGVCKREMGGCVTIKSIRRDHHYVICIIDDGIGFDSSILALQEEQDKGVGLRNSAFRLRELVEAHIDIKSSLGNGCTVTIIIPKVLSEGDMQ